MLLLLHLECCICLYDEKTYFSTVNYNDSKPKCADFDVWSKRTLKIQPQYHNSAFLLTFIRSTNLLYSLLPLSKIEEKKLLDFILLNGCSFNMIDLWLEE